MDWNMVWTIVGANIALAVLSIGTTISLFLWARTEANQDRRQMSDLLNEMKNEMKDFHGRMAAIESRKNNQ